MSLRHWNLDPTCHVPAHIYNRKKSEKTTQITLGENLNCRQHRYSVLEKYPFATKFDHSNLTVEIKIRKKILTFWLIQKFHTKLWKNDYTFIKIMLIIFYWLFKISYFTLKELTNSSKNGWELVGGHGGAFERSLDWWCHSTSGLAHVPQHLENAAISKRTVFELILCKKINSKICQRK